MDTPTNTIFLFIFIVVFILILAAICSKKGRRRWVEMTFGKVLKDYGDIGTSVIRGMPQTLHLYKCSKHDKIFFVLEGRTLVIVSYVALSSEAAQNMIKQISSEGSRN